MKKIWQLWIAAALVAFLLTACGQEETAPVKETTPVETGTPEAEEEVAAFPVTMTDMTDNEITLEEAPKAIVSMIPSNTEILFGLDLGEKVVAVSDYDNYPKETETLEKIGGQEFNVEKIISLNPDLVLAHESGLGMGEAGLQQLRDAGLKVFVVKTAANFEEVYETMITIGQATGATAEAEEMVQTMKDEVAAIQEKASSVETKKSVFIEVSPAPDIYTAGNNTFMNEMLKLINADNIAADQEGWIKMDPEEIVKRNPDVILTTYGSYMPDAADQVLAREGFGAVTAVENKEVFNVNEDTTSRSGPRLSQGLLEMAKAIYPEVFSE
ncbi:ABC transporter substrate-binding protein [Paenisporosarcina sp. TG20]|uniref:ABC transporter substrate-binding protein n=1 Tax=Paenisporosarcina sp. TG20 TaxID=1211706 RepID=UPI0002F40D2E|nr:ABC transporter substrate-binding protein [Paenisporosarcina sp. TG20]